MPKAYNGNNTKKQGKNYKFLPCFFVALYRPVCPIGHIVYLWTWTVRYRDFFLDISTPYTVRPRSYWTHIFKSKIKNFFGERVFRRCPFSTFITRSVWRVFYPPTTMASHPISLRTAPWKLNTIPRHHRVRATMSKWKRRGQASLRRLHGKTMVHSSG